MHESVLPRGITGFFEPGEQPPTVEAALFKRACFEAAQALGTRVAQFDSAGGKVAQNFHAAELHGFSTPVIVLCNAHHPWLALVEGWPAPATPLKFMEAAEVVRAFSTSMDVEIPARSFLEAAPGARTLECLAVGELRQVRYWKPERVGDIVFNCWD